MTEKKQDNRTLVRKFIENHAEDYNLKIHHFSLLRVIAEYCDMTLHYCCLSFSHLEKYSGMSSAQRRKITAYLLDYNLIEQSYLKNKPIHKIGETIITQSESILTAPIERSVTNDIPDLSHDAPIERSVTNYRSNRAPDRSNRAVLYSRDSY